MYSDGAFIEALSERNRAVTPELVEEFCSVIDEEEQGKQLYIKINLLNTYEMS